MVPSSDEFDRWYQEILAPVMTQLERQRRQLKAQLIGTTLGIAALAVAGMILSWEMYYFHLAFPLGVVLPLVAAGFTYHHALNRLRGDYKEAVIRRLVARLDSSLQYRGDGSLDQTSFSQSGFFPGDRLRHTGEDLVWGEIKGVPFGVCELTTRDALDHNTHVDIFHGFFFEIGLTHPVEDRVLVVPRRESFPTPWWVLKTYVAPTRTGIEVTVGDEKFHRQFRVFCESQLAAQEALQPELMDLLLKLKGRKGQKVYLSLVEDKAYLGLTREGDMFEPSLFEPLNDFQQVKSYMAALRLVTSLPARLSLTRDGGVV